MPFDNEVVGARALPPVALVYQLIFVPLAIKFDTTAELQKVCILLPVGIDVVQQPSGRPPNWHGQLSFKSAIPSPSKS